jgi:hypothetical protein
MAITTPDFCPNSNLKLSFKLSKDKKHSHVIAGAVSIEGSSKVARKTRN